MMLASGSTACLDDLGRLVDLEEGEVVAADDVEEDALGALDRYIQQRAGQGFLGGVDGPVLPGPLADGHPGRAGVLHDGLDVGEVQVDHAGDGDDLGDGLHAVPEDVIGQLEGAVHAGLVVAERQQAVVGDDDQGIDLIDQVLDALFGRLHAVGAFEGEGLGDDGDGQGAGALGDLGHDRVSRRCRCRRPCRR